MIIKKIHIAGFGKLVDYEKSFNDGLNTIKEDNGFGKSTIAMFITAMLYGLEGTMQFKAPEKPRVKFAPWSGGAFGGYMEFFDGKKSYRVERSFGKRASEDTFLLIDLNTGTPSSDYSADLGKELFGIDDDGFERTVFLSERNIFGKNENPTIAAKLSNITYADGDIGGFDKAIALLDKERKDLQKRGGAGEIRDIKDEIYRTEADIAAAEYAGKLVEEHERRLTAIAQQISDTKARIATVESEQKAQSLLMQKASLAENYKKMTDALLDDEAKARHTESYFGGRVPDAEELDGVRASLTEIARCEAEIKRLEAASKQSTDTTFTRAIPTQEDILGIRSLGKRLMGLQVKAENVAPKPTSPFIQLPERERISELARGKRGGIKKSCLLLIAIGLVLCAAWLLAFVIEGPLPTVLGIIGIATTALGAALTVKGLKTKQNDDGIREYVTECLGKYPINARCSTASENLGELLRMLESHEADMRIYNGYFDKLSEELSYTAEIEADLRELISRFAEPEEDLVEQSSKMVNSYSVCASERRNAADAAAECRAYEARLAELRLRVSEFMSRYPTDSFDEICKLAGDYAFLTHSIEIRRAQADDFARSNGITTDGILQESSISGDNLANKALLLNDELIAKEREGAALASELRAQQEKYEHIDEYRERLSELNDKVLRAEEKLETVKKTMEMLERAKEQLCARYLDRVRQGFDKYTNQMDSAGVFTVDTSFTVTKNDFGKSRPQEAYSRGTRDLYSLAIRLAITDAIFENDLPPVILDDPFTAFDDTHLKKAQAAVKALAKDRQIIYLTCASSRAI
jgi:DNA repair exonuclease SbcCD ATPase subunit